MNGERLLALNNVLVCGVGTGSWVAVVDRKAQAQEMCERHTAARVCTPTQLRKFLGSLLSCAY